MKEVNFVIVIFDWINLLIAIYLIFKLLYSSPTICLSVVDIATSLVALMILIIARIIKEIAD